MELAEAAGEVLKQLDVDYSINVLSAHRMPEYLQEHIKVQMEQKFLSALLVWLHT